MLSQKGIDILSYLRKWSQLNECEVKNPTPNIETFEYEGKLYDRRKYIDIRSKDLCELRLNGIEFVKKVAIKEPYAHKGKEFYEADLEAMDKAIAIKLEEKLNRRSF